jgi:competence protein ComEA
MKLASKSILVLLVLVFTWNLLPVSAQTADNQGAKLLVNINTAGQAELERLPGIGPSLAKKIMEFRSKNGNFKTPADLVAVQGIGEKKFEQIKNMITVK